MGNRSADDGAPAAALVSETLACTVVRRRSRLPLRATPGRRQRIIGLGAALTVSLRRGGSIVGLLVLPLTGPLLIFGTRATDLSINGEPPTAPLLFLAALAVLALSLGPRAKAAAVKVGLE